MLLLKKRYSKNLSHYLTKALSHFILWLCEKKSFGIAVKNESTEGATENAPLFKRDILKSKQNNKPLLRHVARVYYLIQKVVLTYPPCSFKAKLMPG